MLWWYSVCNGDAVRVSACATATTCAYEDNDKGAHACGCKGEADNACVNGGEAARDHNRDRMAIIVHKGNAKAACAPKGGSEATYVSVHVVIRLQAHAKDLCAVDCANSCVSSYTANGCTGDCLNGCVEIFQSGCANGCTDSCADGSAGDYAVGFEDVANIDWCAYGCINGCGDVCVDCAGCTSSCVVDLRDDVYKSEIR